MRIRVDPTHDTTRVGGKAIRGAEGDAEVFLCWGHIPTLRQHGWPIPEQFERAEYTCDLEAYDDGQLVVHKERAFRTRERALAWFRFVAWCLVSMTHEDVAQCGPAWELS